MNTATYAAAGQLGFSVAGGTNILGDGAGDVILGAPNASVAPTNTTTPVTQNTGVVYVISAAVLPGSTQTIDVSTLSTSQVDRLRRCGHRVTRRAFPSPTAATSTAPPEASTIS